MAKYACFITVFLIFACVKKSEKSSDTIEKFTSGKANTYITGQVENAPKNFVVLIKDSFRDTVYFTAQNRFEFALNLTEGTYFKIADGKSSFKIFVEPKNNLHISFNSNRIFQTVNFTGTGAEANNYMRGKYLLQLDYAMPLEQLYEKPAPEFKHWVDSLYVINKMYFQDFIAKNPNVSEAFKETEWAGITYDRAAQLMEYLNATRNADVIQEPKYLAFLDQLSVNNAALLDIYEYKLFLSAFIEYNAGKKFKTENLSVHEITLIKLQTIIEQIDNQEVKDYLLFTFMRDHVKYYGYKNTQMLFKTFEQACKNEQMRQGLLTPYYEYTKLSERQAAPAIEMVNANGIKTTLQQYAGSYIYIDVWATWCKPCIKEKPYFDALKDKYEHKNITFICISIDKDPAVWKEFISREASEQNQFLATDIQTFTDAYMIKTIPHFILIDDKGNLIDVDASRPSDKNTKWLDAIPNKFGV